MNKKTSKFKVRKWRESDLDQLVKCHKDIYDLSCKIPIKTIKVN